MHVKTPKKRRSEMQSNFAKSVQFSGYFVFYSLHAYSMYIRCVLCHAPSSMRTEQMHRIVCICIMVVFGSLHVLQVEWTVHSCSRAKKLNSSKLINLGKFNDVLLHVRSSGCRFFLSPLHSFIRTVFMRRKMFIDLKFMCLFNFLCIICR